jgi:hypothetical protein
LIEDFLNGFVSKSIGNPGNHSCVQRTETAVSEPELKRPKVIDYVEIRRKYVSRI